jgi:hypothetical protein
VAVVITYRGSRWRGQGETAGFRPAGDMGAHMVNVTTVVYVVGFFVLFVGSMLFLTWRSLQEDVHSPAVEQ